MANTSQASQKAKKFIFDTKVISSFMLITFTLFLVFSCIMPIVAYNLSQSISKSSFSDLWNDIISGKFKKSENILCTTMFYSALFPWKYKDKDESYDHFYKETHDSAKDMGTKTTDYFNLGSTAIAFTFITLIFATLCAVILIIKSIKNSKNTNVFAFALTMAILILITIVFIIVWIALPTDKSEANDEYVSKTSPIILTLLSSLIMLQCIIGLSLKNKF